MRKYHVANIKNKYSLLQARTRYKVYGDLVALRLGKFVYSYFIFNKSILQSMNPWFLYMWRF